MIKNETLDKAREYLCEKGCISIPFLQQKLKLSHSEANRMFKILNDEKNET